MSIPVKKDKKKFITGVSKLNNLKNKGFSAIKNAIAEHGEGDEVVQESNTFSPEMESLRRVT